MSLESLYLIAFIVLLVIIVQRINQKKAAALVAAKQYVEQLEMQFLDQAITFDSLKWQSLNDKNKGLVFVFRFEFSSQPSARNVGLVKVQGRLCQVFLEPHTLQ